MDNLDLPRVMLAFLQADCTTTTNSEYRRELLHIGQEISKRDINCNASPEDGYLETDGHMPSCIPALLQHLQPSVELYGNHADPAILNVAEDLRDVAAQLEHEVVARATQNLSRSLQVARPEDWGGLLSQAVDWVMRHSARLNDLPQERVSLALTLALVSGVCLKAPRLLWNLFHAALRCVGGGGDTR